MRSRCSKTVKTYSKALLELTAADLYNYKKNLLFLYLPHTRYTYFKTKFCYIEYCLYLCIVKTK